MDRFSYEIVEKLGVLSESANEDFAVEVNRISYNGQAPKIDIRKWDIKANRMLKGIALSDEEAKELKIILDRVFESEVGK